MNMEMNNLLAAGCSEENAKFILAVADFGLKRIAETGILPLHAMVAFESDDGESTIASLAAPALLEETKDLFMEMVRFIAHRQNSKAVAIISETWNPPAGKTPEEIMALFKQYGSIGNMPGRTEGIVIALNAEEGKAMVTYDIHRNTDGLISEIKLNGIQTERNGTLEGRLLASRYTDVDKRDPRFQERLETAERIFSSGAVVDAGGGSEEKPKGNVLH